jgi:CHAD domain-containing protein
MKPRIEIESKFLVPDKALAVRLSLASELGGARTGEPSRVAMRDTYYDTPSRALEAAGWSYRLRDYGDRTEACLKALDPGEERKRRECYELGCPPDDVDPARPPGELRSLLAEMIGGEPLETIAVLSQERDRLPLFKDRAMIAELDIDSFRAGNEPTAPTLTMVEVELTARGSMADLEDIRAALESEYGLLPDARTKLDVALASRGVSGRPSKPRADRSRASLPEPSEPAPGAAPAEPAAVGMREFAKSSMAKLAAAVGKGLGDFERRGDPDSVHDLRVSARRALAALDAFEDYLEAEAARRAEKELRRLVRAFGRLRDLDIIIADARARSVRLPERRRAGFEVFVADLEGLRAKQLATLREKSGARRVRLDSSLVSLSVAARGDAAPVATVDAASALALEAYARLRAESSRLDPPPEAAEAYHPLRLQAKRLRYLLELLAPALGPLASGCVSDLRLLQDKLGAMSDAAAAVLFLREYLAPGRETPSPEVAVYLASRQAETERLARSLPGLCRRVAGPSFRRRLITAIAEGGKERA